jgi:F0F1-type ATP synthase assembly protein I
MRPKQPLHKILLSVIAALFGIQSSKKAQDDFKETSPWVFIFIGIGLLFCLIAGLVTVVHFVGA